MNSYHKGLWSEFVAAVYLWVHGYRVRAWRYKTPHGEIDLIASRGKTIVFVEVKVRPNLHTSLEAIRPASLPRLRRAAEHYLNRFSHQAWVTQRFDLIAVAPPWHIRHLDNILVQGS
jgi:putative endonuclease